MKIGIMQPYFFPYIGYFQLIDAVDTFCMYEHVTFRKKSWITRNRILDKGRLEPIFISIPVKGKSSFKSINDVSVNDSEDWKKSILNALFYNYKKAICFDETYSFIESLLSVKKESIHEYNSEIIIAISKWLGSTTKIIAKSDNLTEIELENNPIDKNLDNKTNRILMLCRRFQSSHYINPSGGVELYNKKDFEENGLQINFIKTEPISYKQWGNDCVQNLSIIDMMMHVPKTDIQQFLKSYSLN